MWTILAVSQWCVDGTLVTANIHIPYMYYMYPYMYCNSDPVGSN